MSDGQYSQMACVHLFLLNGLLIDSNPAIPFFDIHLIQSRSTMHQTVLTYLTVFNRYDFKLTNYTPLLIG